MKNTGIDIYAQVKVWSDEYAHGWIWYIYSGMSNVWTFNAYDVDSTLWICILNNNKVWYSMKRYPIMMNMHTALLCSIWGWCIYNAYTCTWWYDADDAL